MLLSQGLENTSHVCIGADTRTLLFAVGSHIVLIVVCVIDHSKLNFN